MALSLFACARQFFSNCSLNFIPKFWKLLREKLIVPLIQIRSQVSACTNIIDVINAHLHDRLCIDSLSTDANIIDENTMSHNQQPNEFKVNIQHASITTHLFPASCHSLGAPKRGEGCSDGAVGLWWMPGSIGGATRTHVQGMGDERMSDNAKQGALECKDRLKIYIYIYRKIPIYIQRESAVILASEASS